MSVNSIITLEPLSPYSCSDPEHYGHRYKPTIVNGKLCVEVEHLTYDDVFKSADEIFGGDNQDKE